MAYTYNPTIVIEEGSASPSSHDITILPSGIRIMSDVEHDFNGLLPYAYRVVNGVSGIENDLTNASYPDMSVMGGSVKIGTIQEHEFPFCYFKYIGGKDILTRELEKQKDATDEKWQIWKNKVPARAFTEPTPEEIENYDTVVRILTDGYFFNEIPTAPSDTTGYVYHDATSTKPWSGRRFLHLTCGSFYIPYETYWESIKEHPWDKIEMVYRHDSRFIPSSGMLRTLDLKNKKFTKFGYDWVRLHDACDAVAVIENAFKAMYLKSKFANKAEDAVLNITFIQKQTEEYAILSPHFSDQFIQSWISAEHERESTSHGIARKHQYWFVVSGVVPSVVPEDGLTQSMGYAMPTGDDWTTIFESFVVTDADGGEVCFNGKEVVVPDSLLNPDGDPTITPSEYTELVSEVTFSEAKRNAVDKSKDRYPHDPTSMDAFEARANDQIVYQRHADLKAQQYRDAGYTKQDDDESGGFRIVPDSWNEAGDWFTNEWVYIGSGSSKRKVMKRLVICGLVIKADLRYGGR